MSRYAFLFLITLSVLLVPASRVESPAAPTLAYPPIPKSAAWERAQWHVQKRLAPGTDRLPMDALQPAREAMAKMPRSHAPGRYVAHNPDRVPKSPAAWESLGPDQKGGRTRRIVFDLNGTTYAAGVSGGVWRREAGRWVALGDRLVNANVGALAISPADDNVHYAGTGELYRRTNRPYSSMTGSGMFKTTNAGADWVQLSATVNDDFAYVSDIVISPNDPNRLYAATNSGIWRSDDGGVSFVQTLATSAESGPRFEGCTDLEIRRDLARDWVLATCASRSTDDRYYLPGLLPDACNGPCDSRIFLNRDADAGGSWEVVLSETGMGRVSLAAFPGDPSILYALAASNQRGPDKNGDGLGDYENGLHAVFRSDDGGQSWAATLRNSSDDPVSTWILSFGWQARADDQTPYGAGWYNQAIAVDPDDPDVVWAGGMQLYRSDDGGASFGLMSNYREDPEVPASRGPYMHPDIHTLVFDAAGQLWIGNDGGVWVATNADAPADFTNDGYRSLMTEGARFDARVSGFTTTQFYHGTVSSDGDIVFGGMQDNGTDALNLPGYPFWLTTYGGDGAYSAYDPDGPFYFFSAQGPTLSRMNGNYEYTWLGDNITRIVPGPDEFMFITPYVLDPSDRTRLFLGGKRLYRGSASGDLWTVASAPFGNTFYDKANALAVSPTNPAWMLIGTGNAIYKNRIAGFSHRGTSLPSTSPREGWVSSLTFDPNDENIAYATYSSFGGDHVWKSTDGGESFFPIDGQGDGRLPDVPVHSLAVDPSNPDHLYIGTDLGIFFTADGGEQWQVEETGFGGAIVERVVINDREDAGTAWLFAFTYGRGVWRAPLAEIDGQPRYTINPAVNGFWYDANEPGHGLQVQVIDQGGSPALLATWYVYYDGEPLWMIGVGEIEGDRAVVPMTVTRGTGFGPDFESGEVVREDWGELQLVFSGDEELDVRWQSPFGDGEAGTLAMIHLSKPTAISVSGADVGFCTSGLYWNPDQNGQGLLVETVVQDGEPALAWSWYNYRDGGQLWLVGSGRFEGDRVTAEAFAGVQGEFPPRFDAATAEVERWGTVEFEFTGERQFTLHWNPDGQPESVGSLDYEQLAFLADGGCS
ncbi:MAG: hypothetical protein R3200_05890 [Xanthomonadales bacterium]|nr:hypothetical protein [Xanthomonadales bacterium]